MLTHISILCFSVLNISKKGLYIVDLEEPWEPVKTLHQQSKWEVGVVEFNPHPSKASYIASTVRSLF